jgi:hypothetical protein
MYLVIREDQHDYVALGFAPAMHGLNRLPAMHGYFPQVPASPGVWGHTLAEGGPFPGGPFVLRETPVAVYAGSKASGQPLTTLRSDADGFFATDLQPGVYTFVMTARDHGFPAPHTVTVRAGAPVAVGVYGEMM